MWKNYLYFVFKKFHQTIYSEREKKQQEKNPKKKTESKIKIVKKKEEILFLKRTSHDVSKILLHLINQIGFF